MNTLASELRYCGDIGMFALDRPISSSCIHATTTCKTRCFNDKLYKMYPAMRIKDDRNEIAWINNDSLGLHRTLVRRKKQTKRVRFMTRGEALRDYRDIYRIENILKDNKENVFWLPTRAWRNPLLFSMAYDILSKYSNIRILASMDDSNTNEEWEHVKTLGLSTMNFDDNINPIETPNGDKYFKCPKTHKHLNGHCSICKGGCFNTKKRVDVHLLEH